MTPGEGLSPPSPQGLQVGVGLWTLQATAAAPGHFTRLSRSLIRDARWVEERGFDSLWLAEHRFWYDGWCPAPLVAAAGVAAATDHLRVGTAMMLLPQHDPLRVARAVTTVDRLSGGRVDLGVGLGHRDPEFDGLGIRRADRGGRMDEALEILVAAWQAGGRFSHEGRHFRYPDQPVHLEPVQQPHPPVWVGGMAPAAFDRAARHGLSFLLPQTLRLEETAKAVEAIRTAQRAAGVAPGKIGLLKDVWVDHDGRAARDSYLPRVEAHYREEAGSWWVLKGQPAHERPDLLDRQMERVRETTVVGTPDEVTAELATLVALGLDLLVVRFEYDVTRGPERDRALGLFAGEVLPVLRRAAR